MTRSPLTITPKVIGLCGGKGQGKDTVAKHLREVFVMQQMAFADPIKEALAVMFNVPVSVFHDPLLKEQPMLELMGRTPRYLMTTLGTEWGRGMVHTDLWTTLLGRRLSSALCDSHSVVVSDVRFDNEARVVLDRGGEVWRITGRTSIYEESAHESEVGIDPRLVSHVIVNNADLRTLHAQIGVAIGRIDRQRNRDSHL